MTKQELKKLIRETISDAQNNNVNDAKLHGYAEWCDKIDLNKIPNNQWGNDVWFNKVNTVINELLK